jgi:pilus assembly protein CpaB
MKFDSRKTLMLAAIAGVLCAAIAYFWFSTYERGLKELSAPARVLVAGQYIASGIRVTPDMVEVKSMPRAFIQPGALSAPEEAIGQNALAPIAPGEQILANKLAKGGEALALAVPLGKRAITIAVDEAGGVAGLVRPGDSVDVLVTTTEGNTAKAYTLIQTAPVLAVGRSFSPKQGRKEERGYLSEQVPATVTLAVSPSEAQVLGFVEATGRIKLLLRSPGDTLKVPLTTVTGRYSEASTNPFAGAKWR